MLKVLVCLYLNLAFMFCLLKFCFVFLFVQRIESILPFLRKSVSAILSVYYKCIFHFCTTQRIDRILKFGWSPGLNYTHE